MIPNRAAHQLLSILITLTAAGLGSSVSVGSHNCTAYGVVNGIFHCFELNSNDLVTFEEAEENCRDEGGSLPVITSPEVNDILLPIAKISRLTWLALVQRTRPWRWADSHSELELQGCYIRNERDFDNPVTLLNMTQDICKSYCIGQGARYAALRVGRECYCSQHFHIEETETGNQNPCNVRCPGNWSQHCGSETESVLIFSLYGTHSHWGSDQPNEHLSYQSCALADADHSYWWNDVKCKELHGALCYKNAPPGLNLTANDQFCKEGSYDSLLVHRTCYIFITVKDTWFIGLSKCTEIGAKLFELSGNEELARWDTLRHHMDRNHRSVNSSSSTSFWVSLFKREWVWKQEGRDRKLLYSNWGANSPSSEKQNCSAINELGRWEDAECERKYPFVCQYDNLTAPFTRPMTTFPTIIKNSLRPLDADPVPAEPFSFRKHGIWLILAGSILLVFIMIFITVAYCRYCHRVREERKKFTLYYGIDVGSASKDGDSQDGKTTKNNTNPTYLDPTAPPLTNGVNGIPNGQHNGHAGQNNGQYNDQHHEHDSEPPYAEYGYTETIEHSKPIKPSEKRRSKYRKSE